MKPVFKKTFGPIVLDHWPAADGVDVSLAGDDIFVPEVDIDEMIKALRKAADWLEWRRACEPRDE